MESELKSYIEEEISTRCGNTESFVWSPIGGGSINSAFRITNSTNNFFVKTNTKSVFSNGFEEEVLGLQFLEKNGMATPEIICEGIFENHIYLVLEWIDSGQQSQSFWENFANQLADLHRKTSDSFGLDHSNFMGQLEQQNDNRRKFNEFFIENRLKPQLTLGFNNGLLENKHIEKFENLFHKLEYLLPQEAPAAVHGDLWSGNFICDSRETAVLIDPAVSYSHREIDMAMSTLFGGFSEDFYYSYQEIYPMDPGFESRKDIYNLYPLLIHLNLFGSSYRSSILRIIDKF